MAANYNIEPRYYHQDIVVPAGTTIAAPVVVDSPTPAVELLSVNVRVPAGHAGRTGFQVVLSQEAVIPYGSPPAWLILDNDEVVLNAGYNTDTSLSFVAYNLDVYDHVFHVDWVCQQPAAGAVGGGTLAATPLATPQPAPLALVGAPLMIPAAVA